MLERRESQKRFVVSSTALLLVSQSAYQRDGR